MQLLVPPPVVTLVCGFCMWGMASFWPDLRVSFLYQDYVAGILVVMGIAILLIAVFAFSRARTTVTPLKPEKASALVTGGLYAWSRNPMYAAMLLLLTGLAVLLGNVLNALILLCFIAYITAFQIKPEEARLKDVFGNEYLDYMKRVGRWF